MTSYEYAGNNPIMENDPNGDLHGYWNEMYVGTGRWYIPTTPGPGNEDFFDPINSMEAASENDRALLAAAQTGDPAAVQAYGEAYGSTISIGDKPFYTFSYKGSGVLNLLFNGNDYDTYNIKDKQGDNGLEVNNGAAGLNTAQAVSLLLNENIWPTGLSSNDITQGDGASQGENSNTTSDGGFDYGKLWSGITTGTDAYGVALSKANVINTVLTGAKIEGKAFKYLTGSGTVVGAIAGGIPAAISIYNNGLNWRNGTAAGLAVLGVVSEFTGLGEAYDGTVGLGIAVGSLSFDIWDAIHPAK